MTARLLFASTLVLALAACTPDSANTASDDMAEAVANDAVDESPDATDEADEADTGLPQMDIYLANISWSDGLPSIDAPRNVTNHLGYDNQPAFVPNSHHFYYSAETEDGTTDAFLNVGNDTPIRLTETPGVGEYSPRLSRDGRAVVVLRQDETGAQLVTRVEQIEGDLTTVLDLDPVGYFAFSGDGNQIAMFVLTDPFTLQVADLTTGAIQTVYENIDRALYATTDGTGAIFTTPRDGDDGFRAMHYSFADGEIEYLFDLPGVSQDYALVDAPDGLAGAFASSEGTLYYRTTNDSDWTPVADLSAFGLDGVTRMAVSDDSSLIAIVAAE